MRNCPSHVAAVTARAGEDQAYVRILLRDRQPGFAALLESVLRDLLAEKHVYAARAGGYPEAPSVSTSQPEDSVTGQHQVRTAAGGDAACGVRG